MGGGRGGLPDTKRGGGAEQSISGPIYEKWGGAIRFRSITKSGGGEGQFTSGPLQKLGGGGQFASGPLRKAGGGERCKLPHEAPEASQAGTRTT